ncbi:MAG: glycosyltransferase family 39 protein [Acidimicrobiales bacterium]|nr:glycosyltransferase family 39 protein [Acidimicrobiales bacterium]
MAAPASERRSRARSVVTAAGGHPIATVAAVGGVLALAHLWWFTDVRALGSFNTDEAGYLANGLRIHRQIGPDLKPLLVAIGGPSTGPLVPMLSMPILLVGPRSVSAAWSIQLVLYVATGMAAAGVARRLAGDGASLTAGLVALCLPAVVLASRSYQFAPAVAATLVGAVWALLASERGERAIPMVAAGVAVGAMLLSRTMAVAFVPAIVLGAAVELEHTSRAKRHALVATGIALLIAGPWWIARWSAITGYLTSYGFGPRATDYGSTGLGGRISQRADAIWTDVRPPFLLLALVALIAGGIAWWRRRAAGPKADEDDPAPPLLDDRVRPFVAVATTVVVAAAVLVATANRGTWFELPVEVLAAALVVAVVAAARPLPRRLLAASALVIALLTVASSLTDRGGTFDGPRSTLYGGLAQDQPLTSEADARFLSNEGSIRAEASAAWWAAITDLLAEIDRRGTPEHPVVVTMTGSSTLANTQQLFLAAELAPVGLGGLEAPDTSDPNLQLDGYLTPTTGDLRRVVVVVDAASAFPTDRGWPEVERTALDAGWEVAGRIPLPDGGEIRVLDHPDAGS